MKKQVVFCYNFFFQKLEVPEKLHIKCWEEDHKLQTTYDTVNSKLAEMHYFYCGPSKDSKGRVFEAKKLGIKWIVVVLTMIRWY